MIDPFRARGVRSAGLAVKICGITQVDDALMIADLGATAVGMLVGLQYLSPDALTVEEAAAIALCLPLETASVMVTHLTEPAEIIAMAREIAPDCIQLHGAIGSEQVAVIRDTLPAVRLIKSVHPEEEDAAVAALGFTPFVEGLLLDSRTRERIGGTGIPHDWGLSREVRSAVAPCPVILAGGLTPANVREAVETVGPNAVDVNTGVKLGPRRKDPEKVRRFIEEARSTDP